VGKWRVVEDEEGYNAEGNNEEEDEKDNITWVGCATVIVRATALSLYYIQGATRQVVEIDII
jgi:hypothetical protein